MRRDFLAVIIFFAALTTAAAYAAPSKESSQERRAEMHHEDSIAMQKAVASIKSGNWVLQVDNIYFDGGATVSVPSNVNFIYVFQGRAVVQTASDNGSYGADGLGGVTVSGSVLDQTFSTDKYGGLVTEFTVKGVDLQAKVKLTLNDQTNSANASVDLLHDTGGMTMYGDVVEYSTSGVVVGQENY